MTVDKQLVSSIGRGLLVLAGVGKGDTEKDADSLIGRILKARLWPEEAGGQASQVVHCARIPRSNRLNSGRRMSKISKGKFYAVCLSPPVYDNG